MEKKELSLREQTEIKLDVINRVSGAGLHIGGNGRHVYFGDGAETPDSRVTQAGFSEKELFSAVCLAYDMISAMQEKGRIVPPGGAAMTHEEWDRVYGLLDDFSAECRKVHEETLRPETADGAKRYDYDVREEEINRVLGKWTGMMDRESGTDSRSALKKNIGRMFDDLFSREDPGVTEEFLGKVISASGPASASGLKGDAWWKEAVSHACNSGGMLWQDTFARKTIMEKYGIEAGKDPDRKYSECMYVYLESRGLLDDRKRIEEVRRYDELQRKTDAGEKQRKQHSAASGRDGR